jgi:hypothetical protein
MTVAAGIRNTHGTTIGPTPKRKNREREFRMADPTVDAGMFNKVLDWAWTAVLGLLAIVHKSNESKHATAAETYRKLDEKVDHEVRCARIEIKGKADSSDLKEAISQFRATSAELFKNAEIDREKTRQMIFTESTRLSETMRLHQTDVMKAIAEIGNGRHK